MKEEMEEKEREIKELKKENEEMKEKIEMKEKEQKRLQETMIELRKKYEESIFKVDNNQEMIYKRKIEELEKKISLQKNISPSKNSTKKKKITSINPNPISFRFDIE